MFSVARYRNRDHSRGVTLLQSVVYLSERRCYLPRMHRYFQWCRRYYIKFTVKEMGTRSGRPWLRPASLGSEKINEPQYKREREVREKQYCSWRPNEVFMYISARDPNKTEPKQKKHHHLSYNCSFEFLLGSRVCECSYCSYDTFYCVEKKS
jgi:hypothetical protein